MTALEQHERSAAALNLARHAIDLVFALSPDDKTIELHPAAAIRALDEIMSAATILRDEFRPPVPNPEADQVVEP